MAKDPMKAPGALGKSIASKIKAARVESGMSQEALGKHLGVTFQQIQKYEKGVNRITLDRLQIIAEKVGRPITYFFEAGSARTAPPDIEIIDGLLGWMGSSRSARRVLAALPSLNEADAELVASLAELLASRRG
jgi:transcriptional regulator with XRE-family HTH domain